LIATTAAPPLLPAAPFRGEIGLTMMFSFSVSVFLSV